MPAITLPTNGGDANAWGPILNNAITAINNAVDTVVASNALKAADNAVVKLTGNQTVAGTKTFSSAPGVPVDSFAMDRITGLVTALAAKAATTYVDAQVAAVPKALTLTSLAAADPGLPIGSIVVVP